jgi:hypothetical protein
MNGRLWSQQELALLTDLYPSRRTVDIAGLLKRDLRGVYRKAFILGLTKTQEFIDSPESGRLKKGQMRPGMEKTQFKKGGVPHNKGLRRPGWSAGRMKETQFRKGNRTGKAAHNWVPVGTIRPDGEGYLRIKVREAVHGVEASGFGNTKVWPLYNRYLWELHNGPIPPKHIVAFKDRNRANCVIGNLELVSMAENARRNRMWTRLPRELAEVIQLSGVLKRQMRRLTNGQEQNQRSA